MPGSTRAHRRLSLLAGSSLVAATLMSATTVALLAPTAARAANECGAGATVDCTGVQAGISYTTASNITLRMNNGVATTATGVVVTATGTATVGVTRVDTPAGSGDPSLVSASGAGLQVTAATGAITVNLSDGDVGDAPLAISGTTAGVQLSTASTTATALSLTTTNGAISASAGAGVQATTTSTAAGNLVVNLASTVSGTTFGVQATSNGTGNQTVTLTGPVTATGAAGVGVQAVSNGAGAGNTTLIIGGAVDGATGVQATLAGTGTQAITLSAGSGDVSALSGPAVQMTSGAGAATLAVGAGRVVRAGGSVNAVVEIANASGARTITNSGVIRSNDAAVSGYDDLAVRVGAGVGAVTLTNDAGALLSGRVSLSNTGTAGISNSGTWHATDASTLGAGATTLTNTAAGVIATNANGQATTFDLQSGIDTFANAGLLAVGEGTQGAATLTFTSLEAWNNSGRVLFGANGSLTGSDGAANDRIVAATTFTGSGASTLVMDVNFTGSQGVCSAAVAADCLDLRGGTTSGQTAIVVNAVGTGRALDGRIVLVDVGGGFSADGRFVLAPSSAGYALNADGDGIIDAGILHYSLLYDAQAQQHFLLGAPDVEAMEPGLFATFARGAWDVATATSLDRGADLRGSGAGGLGATSGAWLRITGAFTDYATTQLFTSGGVTTAYDTGYEQNAVALVGGVDLVRSSGPDTVWVFGLTAGHIDSDTHFSGSPSRVDLKGYSLGAYSSFIGGPVFLDAIVNAAKFDLAYDAPGQGVSIDDGEAASFGFQVEGGYRLNVPDMAAHIEPLLALSYVKTQLEDMTLPDVEARFENVGNLRAGLGLRISGDAAMGDWTTRFSFTGRAWEEFNGETEVTLANAALDLPLVYDDHNDRLGEMGLAVNALGLGNRLSLQAGMRLQFKRGYETRQFSLGARYVW